MKSALTRRDFLKMSGGGLAAAYGLALVGCGGEGGGGQASSVSLFHDKPNWPYNEMAKLSKEAIELKIKLNSYSDTTSYQQTIKSSLRSGESPGLFTWWSGYRLNELAQQGGLADLTSTWETQLEEGNLQEGWADAFTFEGKQYAIPNAVSYWPVFYNKQVFEENNLEPPNSWDELISAADTLKNASVTPFFATTDSRWPSFIWFEEMLIRTDPDFYNRLMKGEESYTDPVVVGVMEEWKSMLEADYFTALDTPIDATLAREFAQGNVAMIPIGSWNSQTFVEAEMTPGEDYDFFVLPNVNPDLKENVIIVETGALSIPTNAPDVEASTRVAEWWVSPEAAAAWGKKRSDVPVNPKAEVDDPVINGLVSTVEEEDYRLHQRYWEATLPRIVESAVDELSRFMLNPGQYMDVLETIETMAQRQWQEQGQ